MDDETTGGMMISGGGGLVGATRLGKPGGAPGKAARISDSTRVALDDG